MKNVRKLLVAGVIAVGVVGSVPCVSSASATTSTGSIRVYLTGKVGGKMVPIGGAKLCATSVAAPAKGTIEGHCGLTNKEGKTTLTLVPAGKWFVTIYQGSSADESASNKATVVANERTKFSFVAPVSM